MSEKNASPAFASTTTRAIFIIYLNLTGTLPSPLPLTTGVRTSHSDFTGRARGGWSYGCQTSTEASCGDTYLYRGVVDDCTRCGPLHSRTTSHPPPPMHHHHHSPPLPFFFSSLSFSLHLTHSHTPSFPSSCTCVRAYSHLHMQLPRHTLRLCRRRHHARCRQSGHPHLGTGTQLQRCAQARHRDTSQSRKAHIQNHTHSPHTHPPSPPCSLLPGAGSFAGVMAGIEWSVEHASQEGHKAVRQQQQHTAAALPLHSTHTPSLHPPSPAGTIPLYRGAQQQRGKHCYTSGCRSRCERDRGGR